MQKVGEMTFFKFWLALDKMASDITMLPDSHTSLPSVPNGGPASAFHSQDIVIKTLSLYFGKRVLKKKVIVTLICILMAPGFNVTLISKRSRKNVS